MSSNSLKFMALMAGGIALMGGCGKSAIDKVIVSGEVRYNDKPLENGQIRFVPIGQTKGPISGGVIKDGRYTASGKNGVPVGTHRVEIRSYRPRKGGAGPLAAEGAATEQFLPAEYNGESTLEASVTADNASSPIDFSLKGT